MVTQLVHFVSLLLEGQLENVVQMINYQSMRKKKKSEYGGKSQETLA